LLLYSMHSYASMHSKLSGIAIAGEEK
jgi:hypothetical protein